MKTDWKARGAARTWTLALLALLLPGTLPARNETRDDDRPARTLYVWAGDQARVAPDFLAVIDFDEDSPRYGKVIRTVPVPGPGGSGNEPHHCNLSADKNILACGGLLALLKGQNSIFFFDVSNARHPRFLFSTSGTLSNITDDFLPLKEGGFLVTQMGSHEGGTPGRVAEFDRNLQLVAEWPTDPPLHDFNPHGISARPDLNLMVTSDFMMPASSLNVVPAIRCCAGSSACGGASVPPPKPKTYGKVEFVHRYDSQGGEEVVGSNPAIRTNWQSLAVSARPRSLVRRNPARAV